MNVFGSLSIAGFSILLAACSAKAAATPKPVAAPGKQPPHVAPNKNKTPDTKKDKPQYYVGIISLNPVKGGLGAKDVISALGSTDPYSLKAADDNTLVIYRPKPTAASDEKDRVSEIKKNVIDLVVGKSELIRVPHLAYLGDLTKAIQNIPTSKNIIVTPLAGEQVRLTRRPGVLDDDYNAFKNDLMLLAWQMKMESPVARVFYVNAADVGAAIGGKDGAKGGGSGSSGDKSGGTQTQTDTTTTTTINQVCLTPGTPPAGVKTAAQPGAGAASDPAPDPSSQDSSNADPGSGSQDKSGQSSACAVASPSNADNSQKKDSGDQSAPSVSVSSVNDDLLVFNAQPGHDGDISEKKRVLANLDFPRPEVLLNIWSFQASSSRMNKVSDGSAKLRNTINLFNDSIQKSIDRTWAYLQLTLDGPGKFDPTLYPYLTKEYVGFTGQNGPKYIPASQREKLDICPDDQYCLGYGSLFHPLRPTLTDMLLETIVANTPGQVLHDAITTMEGDYTTGGEDAHGCQDRDGKQIQDTVKNNPGKKGIPIHCFEEEAALEIPVGDQNSRAGLLRAALANFLFHFKMSQQYPHEFSPYDLTQSAQELNSALNPLIIAFNRDLSAMLEIVSQNSNSDGKNGWFGFGGHGSTFINNGVITVRTLSGKSTTVDTITQSVFDATNPPSITDVINSVGKAESNLPGVLKTNLTANQAAAIIGALNSVTPAQSKIGREFKVSITPRSLSGASSSELQVSLDAKESAEPTLYTSSGSSTDNISRVGDHSVDTKVRLDSIKLFEISSFSALLERSRRNFPLLLPGVELPYIGSIISIPMPGAKEYHRSTAVISAIVVPTAIDIVSGMRFNFDRVLTKAAAGGLDPQACVNSPNENKASDKCSMRIAVSTGDLSPYSIPAYHREMVACIATKHPFAGSNAACDKVKLSDQFTER